MNDPEIPGRHSEITTVPILYFPSDGNLLDKSGFISRNLIIECSQASLSLTNIGAVKCTFLTSSALPKSHFRKLPGKNHRVFFFEVCWSQWKRQFKSAENLSGGRLNLGRSFTFSCYFLRCCSTFSRVFDKDGKCLPHFGFINISRVPGDLFSSNSSSGWLWELALPPSFTTLAARY